MQVKILKRTFGGVEFCPEYRVLHLGGESSANVERLTFCVPEEWEGKSITLHIRRQDGSLPTPILLDENHSAAVGKEFTASRSGLWMLLALGEDGYRALTRPAKYDCYETLNTEGDAEITPSQYETFVAQVLSYANAAQQHAKNAGIYAAAAKKDAERAETARAGAEAAAVKTEDARQEAETFADRSEAAAKRAEVLSPEDGKVVSVNGKGGVVTLTAEDVGAVAKNSPDVMADVNLTGKVIAFLFADGSVKTAEVDTYTKQEADDKLAAKADSETVNNALAAKADDAAIRNALKEALAEKLGLHDTADDSTKWAGLTLRQQHNTSDTWIPVFCEDSVDYVLKSEIVPAKLGQSGNPDIPMQFNWSGQNGQPTWLWGGNDGTNMYVYNPSNFSVNYANNAGNGLIAASGNYARFGGGIQICFGWMQVDAASRIAFPVPFNATPAITLTRGYTMAYQSSNNVGLWFYNQNNTGFNVSGNKPDSQTGKVIYGYYIAVGTWG